MPVDIQPLTRGLWPSFEDLFGKQGACYGCWCTYFRLPPAARRANDRHRKKEIIRGRIVAGPSPGLLAFDDGQAVGWMQIVGSTRVFEKAGFSRLVERKAGRPLMRYVL